MKWIVAVIVGAALVSLITGSIVCNHARKYFSNQQADVRSSSVSPSASKQRETGEPASSTARSQSSSAQSAAKTERVRDVTDYADLDAPYAVSNDVPGGSLSISFARRSFGLRSAMGGQSPYQIDEMLKHPDGSLVVNGHTSLKDAEGKSFRLDMSLLIVPGNCVLTHNWQTNKAIGPIPATTFPRIAVAQSPDNGKTFDMAPAYQAFIDYPQDSVRIASQNGATEEIFAQTGGI
ncbi:hypothetical protein [Lacticaseibacillus yichunensis]|nr:hypothetical protein [Lacticaseibacillus yichunensis]